MSGRIEHVGQPGRAGKLLKKADGLLMQAAGEEDPRERFRTAYLAALRGAGAVLAFTGADAAPRARSRNAWVLLQRAAPEFVMWADYFSARSETRAALEAGLDRDVDNQEADELFAGGRIPARRGRSHRCGGSIAPRSGLDGRHDRLVIGD
jgi:hypothetical protein